MLRNEPGALFIQWRNEPGALFMCLYSAPFFLLFFAPDFHH
ncbi:hypothetical protein SeGA_4044 [Salmonella enterica subsp. enterica serovar Gaminara str. A4-567]|nr:hypothetical protein SeGA_4044 [Salmonella enterica subsp. enterica serovar Gaminara str. A4-567]